MATSNHRLEQQRRLRLLREEREIKLRKALTEKAKSAKKIALKEGVITGSDFEQKSESFFDLIDLQEWIDDLVDEWGMEPEFEEVWPALQKEEQKFAGFVGEMGLPMLKQHVHEMLAAKKEESGRSTGYEEDPIFEAGIDEERKDAWKKSKERREEHQKEIQKGVLEEQNDQSATSIANRALQDAESARIGIDELVEKVGVQDEIFENLALGLRDPHKLKQLVKFARRDAQGLVSSLRSVVKALPSEVVAEAKKADIKKSNLDLVLEQCDLDEAPPPPVNEELSEVDESGLYEERFVSADHLAERVTKILSAMDAPQDEETIRAILRKAGRNSLEQVEELLERIGEMTDKLDILLDKIQERWEMTGGGGIREGKSVDKKKRSS